MNVTVSQKAWLVWLVAVGFVQFQFILQLSSGVLITGIMKELSLSAFSAGLLSSSYYYVYASLQAPAGAIFDRFDIRKILTCGALFCALGCLIFSVSHSLSMAFIARLTMGCGAAFAFVGMMTLVGQWFPATRFAYVVGLSEALALLGTIAATVTLASALNSIGWRNAMRFSAMVGLLIALLCWLFIEEKPQKENTRKKATFGFLQSIKIASQDKLAWLNGLYIGIGFSIITVYAALWSPSFLQQKLGIDLHTAAILTSFIYLGAVIGCPLYGYLSSAFNRRKRFLYFSSLSTVLIFLALLYLPSSSLFWHGTLNLLLGLCCSSYMLAFSTSNQLAPPGLMNTYTGFTNALSVVTAPCLQPLIGLALDVQTPHKVINFTTAEYQNALLIIPACFVLAAFILIPLPDANSEEHYEPAQ